VTPAQFALHALAVALLVYGIADSRLLRAFRIRVYRWAYTRGGADLEDETWASIRANPFEWDQFVHADDDPPKLAVLVICHWCSGFYLAGLWTTLWAVVDGWPGLYAFATVWLAVVPVEVAVLAAITRLSR
jgi:hypothetical protein